ncbi:MAG: DUF4422 domain-containing protein [Lachnospiraceae bacterium]|nr:DUF4422 domain-containing protein [Lachnospiraceae bacterium]
MAGNNPKIQVIVAAHKLYPMPTDKMYLPVHVGAAISDLSDNEADELGFTKDNTGDNISDKNAQYCELTGLYWAWKNVKADYLGLVHYRRYFTRYRFVAKGKDLEEVLSEKVLTMRQARILAEHYKVIVPEKRRYYIETLYSHYAHTHYAEHLDKAREVISRKYPAYLDSFDEVMTHTYGYMFNMMLMERHLVNRYCKWLFDILGELEGRIVSPENDPYQGRYLGRIAEIIFNVWLDHQVRTGAIGEDEIKELPCVFTEKVNWVKKGSAFLRAKFLKKKYDTSF